MGCHDKNQTTNAQNTEELIEDENFEDEELSDEELALEAEELFDDSDNLDDIEQEGGEELIKDEDINYEQLDAEEDLEDDDIYEEEDYVQPQETKPISKPVVKSNPSGQFFVIVGSYLLRENAGNMKSKLDNMGYSAEILNFDGSQYHVVTSGRYRNLEEANKVGRTLKGKGIDNYVHRRK